MDTRRRWNFSADCTLK